MIKKKISKYISLILWRSSSVFHLTFINPFFTSLCILLKFCVNLSAVLFAGSTALLNSSFLAFLALGIEPPISDAKEMRQIRWEVGR